MVGGAYAAKLLSKTRYINKALVICYSVAVGLGLAGFLSSLISDPQEITRVILWLSSTVVAGISAGMHDAVNYIQQLAATENIERLLGEAKNQVVGTDALINNADASIEAARAGVRGQGFAVAAQEINSLSNQTGSFIKQITEIIDTLSSKILSMKSAADDMMSANRL